MSPKRERFVEEYLIDLNGTQAAIRAGYSPKTAQEQAAQMLANAEVSAAITAKRQKQADKLDLSAIRVLEELRRVALLDIRTLFDSAGNLKPPSQWDADQGAAVGSLEVIIKNAAAGDGKTDTVHKIKLWDKNKALESLAKHFGLLIERVRVEGDIGAIIAEGRARAAARNRKP